MRAALLALALAGDPGGPAAARPPGVEAAVVRALRTAPAGGARAAAATRPLHGLPYVPSALGEGAGPDPDPRFRLDAFDCWTFVETAVALGSAADLEEAARALDDVRYGGAPSLAARHHEVLSQWVPANLAKGWVEDVTRALAGDRTLVAEKTYDAGTWEAVRRAGRAVAGMPRVRRPEGRHALDVVAPGDLAALAPRLPEGALVLVVRADAPDRATRISHAGLVVLGAGGERRVRHATSTKQVARVIEEPVERFVAREAKALPRWPLTGFAVLAIKDARARLHPEGPRAR